MVHAGRRQLALPLLLVLLVAPLVPAQPAPAAPPAAWFGPTDMLEGWHFRVAFSVRNPYSSPLFDATVGRDVAVTEELVRAGWVTSRQGGAVRLESWELDPASVRVVEHRNLADGSILGGSIVGEVPSRAFPGLFDSTKPFHARTAPDLHVQWVAPGVFPPNSTRHFYVYLDTLTNGEKPAAAYPERDMGPLDGRYWISRGTLLYGAASHLVIAAGHDGTEVRVETWRGGRPEPLDLGEGGNPVRLNRTQHKVLLLSESPQPVRLVANRPVVAFGVVGTDVPNGAVVTPAGPDRFGGVIPSMDGNVLGTEFIVPSLGLAALVVAPLAPADVVQDGRVPFRLGQGGARALSFTDGSQNFLHPRDHHVIASSAPVMLLAWPAADMPVQWASRAGAPVGSELVGLPQTSAPCLPPQGGRPQGCRPSPSPPCTYGPNDLNPGSVAVTTYDARTFARGRALLTGDVMFPLGSLGAPSPRAKELRHGDLWVSQAPAGFVCPLLVHAASTAEARDVAPARLAAFGGAAGRQVATPVGGVAAMRFLAHWPVTVLAFHDGTQVEVRSGESAPLRKGLGANDLFEVRAGTQEPVEIVSTKPIALLPMERPGGAFVGLDMGLQVTQPRPSAYRGHLVSIEPVAGATEPMVGVAAAGKPVAYRMVVKNLAKDERGAPVADTLRIGVDAPGGGWLAELSESEVRLGGGEAREVTLTVTPPAEVDEGAPLRLHVHVASEANPRMADRLVVVTVVRAAYAVDAWFERENGPRSRTLPLDAGATVRVSVVVKNLADVPDRVSVQASAPGAGWKARIEGGLGAARNLLEVALEPGESRVVPLLVEAPAGEASQSLVDVVATSQNDAAAAARVSATVRLRADVRIALEAPAPVAEAAPGETAELDVTFLNRGADRVSIRFNATGILPEGWGPVVTRNAGVALDELSGIQPGESLPLRVSVRVPSEAAYGRRASVQFYVETIPQAAGDVPLRESVDLLVLAGRRHALVPLDPAPAFAPGEDGVLRARLALRNDGNGAEELVVVPLALPRGVGVSPAAPARIPQGERGVVDVTLRVAPDLPAGAYPVEAEVRNADGDAVPWRFNLTVPARPHVRLTPLSTPGGVAGVARTLDVEVVNVGNAPLALPPRLAAPEGWMLSWDAKEGELSPGEAVTLPLRVAAPREAEPGVVALAPDPAWARGAALAWDLRTVALSAGIVDTHEGVKVQVRNGGTGDALDVEVVIDRRGVVLDRVVMPRIPAGAESLAILMPREAGEAVLRVDPGAKYAAPIELALPAAADETPFGAMLAPLALMLVALLARRKRA